MLQVLLAAPSVVSGLGTLILEPTTAAGFAAMGIGPSSIRLLGVLELLGAGGLLLPRVAGRTASASRR